MPIDSFDGSVQKFQKGFLSTNIVDDPTYFGFKIIFDWTSNSPLFYLNNDQPSAYYYLRNIGMHEKAEMIKKFREILENLNKYADYYFQAISGLDEIWNFDINSDSKFRGAEKLITIDMLEGMDLRVTALMDLYRKACYDISYMREILPENLRNFKCYVLVSEFRQFHTLMNNIQEANSNGEITNRTIDPNKLQPFNNLISTLTFELVNCRFDFSKSGEFLASLTNKGDSSAVSQRISFTVDQIREKHEFQLLDLITDEFRQGTKSEGFTKNVYGNNEEGNSRTKAGKFIASKLHDIENNVADSLNARKDRLEAKLTSQLRNIYEEPIDKIGSLLSSLAIGNVYGFLDNPLESILKAFIGHKEESERLNLSYKEDYDNTKVNDQQPPLSPINELKQPVNNTNNKLNSFPELHPEINNKNEKLDSIDNYRTDVNKPGNSLDGIDDLNPATNIDQTKPSPFDEYKIGTTPNQKAPTGYDEYKIGTSADQMPSNNFDEYKIPTNIDGDDFPIAFEEYKIGTNIDQKTPESFNEYKDDSIFPIENLEGFDEYKITSDEKQPNLFKLDLDAEVNKESTEQPFGFNYGEVEVNGDNKIKLNGVFENEINTKDNTNLTGFNFDKTEVNGELNTQLNKIDMIENKSNVKINPDDFEFDKTPVNKNIKSEEAPLSFNYDETPVNKEEKKPSDLDELKNHDND